MKTRFEVGHIFLNNGTLQECFDYYENNLKEYGFILDKEREEVFKEYNRQILLNEGDRIEMDGLGLQIISWKCYDPDNDIMIYTLIEE